MAKPLPLKKAAQSAGEQRQEDAYTDSYEAPEEEKTAVKHWLMRVARAEKDAKDFCDLLKELRGYADGSKHDDKNQKKLARTNLIFATIANMVPRIYARNPEVAVTPSKNCSRERLKLVKDFCKTAEQYLNEVIVDEAGLKKRAKANIRSAMVTSYGVLKMVFQEEYKGDPIIVRRIQDTQDNLAKAEQAAAETKSQTDPGELALARDELKRQLEGLKGTNEIRIFKGFNIDRLRSEDFLILDSSIVEFDEYVDARALAQRSWMTCHDYRAKFGHYPAKADKFNSPYETDPATSMPEGMRKDDQYVCVLEIWDKESQSIITVAKGSERFCREHYAPRHTSQRWYPFFVLGFNITEGRWRPISDVELLMGLQDEYNTTRTNYADVRERAVPRRVFRKGGNLTPEDIEALTNSRNKDWIGVEGNPATPINQDVLQLDAQRIDPQAYDVTMIRNDVDLMSGMSDAGRANLIKPKTATEAEIMDAAMDSRNDERRDVNEDLMSDMMVAGIEIGLRAFTQAEIKQVCGEEAVWPGEALAVEEIYSMVDVGVRAGSSGKPNAAKEKEQWLQLLPVVKETMTAVAEARATGNMDMANAAIELLRETMRRFEERIDVDSLIPPMEEGGEGQMLQQAMAKVQELTVQLEAAQEELQAAGQERDKAVAGEQERVVKEQSRAEEQARKDAMSAEDAARAERDAAAQAERDISAAAREDDLARYRIDKEAETKVELARINASQTDEQKAEKDADMKYAEELRMVIEQSQKRHDEAMAKSEEIINGLQQALQALMKQMAEIAKANNGKRRGEIVLGADGLPKAIISEPVETRQ